MFLRVFLGIKWFVDNSFDTNKLRLFCLCLAFNLILPPILLFRPLLKSFNPNIRSQLQKRDAAFGIGYWESLIDEGIVNAYVGGIFLGASVVNLIGSCLVDDAQARGAGFAGAP